jgi:hypothetical protein
MMICNRGMISAESLNVPMVTKYWGLYIAKATTPMIIMV